MIVCVVDGSGVIKSTTHFHDKNLRSIAVDKLNDLIYVMYAVGLECAVDVMSPDGSVTAEKILISPMYSLVLHCSITNTGQLMVGIGSQLSVYRQTMKSVSELSL